MLMQVHMSYAHADTHLICSLRYTCQLLTCWAAQCYAQADTRPSCLLAGLLDAMLMQIHMWQLLTCWAAPDVGLKTE